MNIFYLLIILYIIFNIPIPFNFRSTFRLLINPKKSVSLSLDWEKLVGRDSDMDDDIDDEYNMDSLKKEHYHFITGSSYTGDWNVLGLCGYGNYTMPHSKNNIFNIKNLLLDSYSTPLT